MSKWKNFTVTKSTQQPVPAGTLVDVSHRNGTRHYGVVVGSRRQSDWAASDACWKHSGYDLDCDIIAWRLSVGPQNGDDNHHVSSSGLIVVTWALAALFCAVFLAAAWCHSLFALFIVSCALLVGCLAYEEWRTSKPKKTGLQQ